MKLTSWDESRLLVSNILAMHTRELAALETKIEELEARLSAPPDAPAESRKYTRAAMLGAGGGAAVATFVEVLQWLQQILQ